MGPVAIGAIASAVPAAAALLSRLYPDAAVQLQNSAQDARNGPLAREGGWDYRGEPADVGPMPQRPSAQEILTNQGKDYGPPDDWAPMPRKGESAPTVTEADLKRMFPGVSFRGIGDPTKLDTSAERRQMEAAGLEKATNLMSALRNQLPPEVLELAKEAEEYDRKNSRKKVDWGVKSGNWTPGVNAAVEGIIEGWKQGGSPARGLLYAPGAVKAAVEAEQTKLDKYGKEDRDRFMQILGLKQGDVASRNAAKTWQNQLATEMAKTLNIPLDTAMKLAEIQMGETQFNVGQANTFKAKDAELRQRAEGINAQQSGALARAQMALAGKLAGGGKPVRPDAKVLEYISTRTKELMKPTTGSAAPMPEAKARQLVLKEVQQIYPNFQMATDSGEHTYTDPYADE